LTIGNTSPKISEVIKCCPQEADMKTAFGRYAEELRVKRGITQTLFSEKTGMSLSRISNIENQRTNISDDVIGLYIEVLDCSGMEATELRKKARFSNGLRKRSNESAIHTPLQVLFEQFGDKISPSAVAQIQLILERETGEKVEALQFASNHSVAPIKSTSPHRIVGRPNLSPQQLAKIAIDALDFRRRFFSDTEKLNVEQMLQKLSVSDSSFDYRILEALPAHLDGAFACILGHSEGHTVLLEEARFRSATKGVHFARHVVCHEIAHHVLHSFLLKSDHELFLAPQQLAKNSSNLIGSEKEIKQLVNTPEEVEAEAFATFLLVPWEEFLKGTIPYYIAREFGEQQGEVERYARYFKIRSFVNAFREILWARGESSHSIFHQI
jgi:transcriptional regulator with XRE-family HTH domain